MYKSLLFFTFFIAAFGSSPDRPEVTTPLGQVRGYLQTSHGGRKFTAFEGIPYAKPPIGEKRFQAPEPIDPWDGVWDAVYLTQCLQIGLMNPNTTGGEEDCLYLNVYVPGQRPSPSDNLDVIVHIHGGAFMLGSGHSYTHPEYLMDREVILVTMNYRLGIFGFLSTEDDVVPGNNGLKDQVVALKWVQNNIGSFGGNPDSVTLTGLSAGGASVHLHYLSGMSKGLFHRGFSQSGVALNPFAIQEEALTKTKMVAEAVGCPNGQNQVMVECLKRRHSHHLITTTHAFYKLVMTPIAPFGPVIEKGSKSFLNENPYVLLAKGKIHDLPWITSNVAHEGMLPGAFFYRQLEEIETKWEEIAAFLLDYHHTLPVDLWKSTAAKIKEFYLGGKQISLETFPKLVQLLSDRLFLIDTELAVKLQAKANKSPVYYLYFGYPGDHSQNGTVSHADDAQYLFYNMFQRKEISDNEIKMKNIMVDMLTSFATNGKPTVSGVEWKPTGHEELTVLNITSFKPEDIKLENVKKLAPTEFWASLGIFENENLRSFKDEL